MQSVEPRAGWLGRGIALLLAGAFVLSFPLALLVLAWGRLLFSPAEMGALLAEELADGRVLQRTAAQALLEAGSPSDGPNPADGSLSFLDPQELERVVETLFPPEWTQDQIRNNVEIFYGWIDSDLPRPPLRIDLRPLVERLQAGGAAEVVELVVDSWPVCSPEQLQQLELALLTGGELATLQCEPPEPLRGQLILVSTGRVLDQAEGLPASVGLASEESTAEELRGLERLKRGLRLVRELADVGWMVPASLLGLIVALAVRSWPALLRWWGASLGGAGLVGFLDLFFARAIVARAQDAAALRSLGGGGEFGAVLRSVVGRLMDSAGGQMVLLAFLLTLVGAVGLLAGLWLGRRSSSAG